MAKSGLMIVLEGSDGSGKATQLSLLSERLKAAGYDVAVFDFPRYGNESSHFIKQYLAGNYGPAVKVSPYTASLFYALDRYEAAKDIKKELEAGKIVLVDRFVGSNMAHQGSKFSDPAEQRGFFVWADNLEYGLLGIPRPDLNLFLRVPAETSASLMSGKKRDQHEKDIDYLKKSVATYDLLCRLFPKDFTAIECTKNGDLLSLPQISNLIWERIKPILPKNPPHSGHAAVITLGASPAKSSAKAETLGEDKLIHEFKNSSLLLKLAVERQLDTVDPAGFTIWSDNEYRFITPMGLTKELRGVYKDTMAQLAQLHQQMRQRLEVYYERNLFSSGSETMPNISKVLLPVTPLAALCQYAAVFTPKDIQKTASQLLASDSQELQWTAQQLFAAARQTWPQDFKHPLESAGNPEPLNNIITKLAEDKLSLNSGDRDNVKLLEALPRQEFDLLAESIYPYSSLSLNEISEEVSNWSYSQKYESLKNSLNDPATLGHIRYKFDIISDHLALSEAVNAARLNSLQVQSPSPRFGYEVPAIVEAAGIDELYLECFDASLSLFSALQQADRDDLTVYSTLLGHKLRWQFQADAQAVQDLLGVFMNGPNEAIAESISEKISIAHPLTWEVLSNSAISANTPKARQNRVKPAKRRRPKTRRSGNKDS